MPANQLAPVLAVEDLIRAIPEQNRRRVAKNPVKFFGWHENQKWTLFEVEKYTKKDIDIVLICGGNRGGKSALGKGLLSEVVWRRSPLWRKLTKTSMLTGRRASKSRLDPLQIWVVPPNYEKARHDWAEPTDGFSIRYWLGELFVREKRTPDHVFYSRPPDMSQDEAEALAQAGVWEKLDKIILKSQDQDKKKFEASGVDLIIVDEEIDDTTKWNSMVARLGTTNGTLVMCYTPLDGLTWSYDMYWKPLVKLSGARPCGDRRWIKDDWDGPTVVCVQFGAGDNPVARDWARKQATNPSLSEAEKNARLYGEYGYVEGALVKDLSGISVLTPDPDHDVYVVDELPGQYNLDGNLAPGHIVKWVFVADPNKSYGALLSAVDSRGNLFFVASHLKSDRPDRYHATEFTKMINMHVPPGSWVSKWADPGSAGAHSITNLAAYGHNFQAVEKGQGSVSESVKRLRSLAWRDPEHRHPITGEKDAPRLYFYRPGLLMNAKDGICLLAEDISQARQTDNKNAPPDTPHKSIRSKLDLFDCARYTTMVTRLGFQSFVEASPAKLPSDLLPQRKKRSRPEPGAWEDAIDCDW